MIEVTNTNNSVSIKTVNQTTLVGGVKPEVQGLPMDWYLKEDKANKVTHMDEHSSDIQYPSAKCVYDAISQIQPSTGVQSDWNQTDDSAPDYIKNKPEIPVVPTDVSAFTNDAGYITINDVPAQVNADWNSESGASQILNKPTIPAAQVNSDWDSASGVSQILNKPDLSLKEDKSNITQTISSQSLSTQYPSAIAVYNYIQSLDGSQVAY